MPTFPKVMSVEGYAQKYFYHHMDFRPPYKGEYYVSGGPPQIWRAPNDFRTPFHIVEPTYCAVPQPTYIKGEPFKGHIETNAVLSWLNAAIAERVG